MITQSVWKDIIIDMNTKIAKLIKMLCFSIALLFLFKQIGVFHKSANENQNSSGGYVKYDFAMGTSFCLELYGKDAKQTADYCMELVRHADEWLLSRRSRSSELYKLNDTLRTSDTAIVSQELYEVLNKTNQVCQASEGAFDFTIRPLSALWNIEEATADTFFVPDSQSIAESLKRVGYEHVTFLDEGQEYSVSVDMAAMEFELGAVGKGYVLDLLKDYLAKNESIYGAVIHAGGSILIYGGKADNSNWRVGVRNPKGSIDDIIGYLEFEPGSKMCISTSGDYEKYIEKDGETYHHILSGIDGYPADAGLSSVTVVCEDGLLSDALSTACFILGYEKSLTLLQTFHADAVFIDHENHVICTEGIAGKYYAM